MGTPVKYRRITIDSINNLYLFQTLNISCYDDTMYVKLLFIKNLKQTEVLKVRCIK